MRNLVLFLTALGVAQAPLRAQPPTITNQPASRTVWAGADVTLAVGVSAVGPCSYQWHCNGTSLANGIITSVAGIGDGYGSGSAWGGGYSGDGGAATNAELLTPGGVAVDATGNLFIADSQNQRIRKVGTNGVIITVAGNGTEGYSGDGGAATNAELFLPFCVAVDATGNLFIADYGSDHIRKVGTNGIITTVAGSASGGYSGDGGAATNAELFWPMGMAVDATGNLFIADARNNCIRQVDTNGIITTVAGNGYNAGGMAGGYSGDGGAATNAELSIPWGVAVDATGNLLIADSGNSRIRKVGTNGIITTVAGNGTKGYFGDGGAATNAELSHPSGVAVDATGNLFIADQGENRIRKVDANGIITTEAGNGYANPGTGFGGYSGDGGAPTNAELSLPCGVAVDAIGNLFIADYMNNRIRKVTQNQGPTLALTNASAANAGSYQLVVTSPGGSVTSSAATLAVATSPFIYATTRNSDGSVTLSFVSPPGSTSMVLCATNLVPPVRWPPLSTNIAGADGDWQFTDASAASSPEGFYRSVTQ